MHYSRNNIVIEVDKIKKKELKLLDELQIIKMSNEHYKTFESRIFVLTTAVVSVVGLLASSAALFTIMQNTTFDRRMNEVNQKINQIDKAIAINDILSDISLSATAEERIQNLNKAIEMEPNNARLYYYRAITNYNKNSPLSQPDKELNIIYNDCLSAIKYNVNYADAYFLIGKIFFECRQNYSEAYDNFLKASEYQRELTVDISKGQLYKYLGVSCFQIGKYKEAIDYLENIADTHKKLLDSPSVSYTSKIDYMLAKSYELNNRMFDAINSYDKLIDNTYDARQKIEICNLAIDICNKVGDENKKEDYLNKISQFEKGNYR